MLEHAKNKLGNNVLLIEGNVLDSTVYPQGDISVIASRGVLFSHYCEQKAKLLIKIIFENLIPNGFVFLDAIRNGDSELPNGKKAYSENELKKLAENAGFSTVNIFSYEKVPLLFLKAEKNV
jgi:hypothetical protein